MKKKFLVILVAVMFTASYANAQLSVGGRLGLNLTTVSTRDFDGKKPHKDDRYKFKPGFQIGAVADYALSNELSIQPGLIFSQLGYKKKIGKTDAKVVTNLNYIQLPANLMYKLDVSGFKLFAQAGPYLGIGINGKVKMWDGDGKRVKKEDIPFAEDDWDKIKFGGDENKHNFKALDFGFGVGAGIQFNEIQIALSHSFGLLNADHKSDFGNDKSSTRNHCFAITATYLFGL